MSDFPKKPVLGAFYSLEPKINPERRFLHPPAAPESDCPHKIKINPPMFVKNSVPEQNNPLKINQLQHRKPRPASHLS
jgi:hypothetical protein